MPLISEIIEATQQGATVLFVETENELEMIITDIGQSGEVRERRFVYDEIGVNPEIVDYVLDELTDEIFCD